MRFVVVATVMLMFAMMTFQVIAIEIKSYDVSLEKVNEGYKVIEHVVVERNNDTSIVVWIQGEANSVSIEVNGSKVNFSTSGNLYSINLTGLKNPDISIYYYLPESTEKFMKQILYRCKEFTIKLNGEIVYQGTNLSEGSHISFSIKERVIERVNYYMYSTLFLLLILVIVLAYSVRSKKRIETKGSESPELLKAKKELLMNVLKEIEKKYRSKELSEEVYNRLKEDFKRETVNVVRKLDEIDKS